MSQRGAELQTQLFIVLSMTCFWCYFLKPSPVLNWDFGFSNLIVTGRQPFACNSSRSSHCFISTSPLLIGLPVFASWQVDRCLASDAGPGYYWQSSPLSFRKCIQWHSLYFPPLQLHSGANPINHWRVFPCWLLFEMLWLTLLDVIACLFFLDGILPNIKLFCKLAVSHLGAVFLGVGVSLVLMLYLVGCALCFSCIVLIDK